MAFTLVVTSHGRWDYLWRAVGSVDLSQFDRLVISFDGVDLDRFDVAANYLQTAGWEILTTGPERQGLTANLAQAWGALTDDDEWVFHLEEDFVVGDAPLEDMAATLDAFPQVANMVLLRQPWNQEEIRAGSVLRTRRFLLTDMGGWLQHEAGFWLNPFVAHAQLLRTLTPGVEKALTNQCRQARLTFGYWGGRDDPPRCWHIGAEGGMGSEGWLP